MSAIVWRKHDTSLLARVSRIASIKDKVIWKVLVTPEVKRILGDFIDSRVDVSDRVAGDFPGDEVSNLNDHRLYGGQTGYVRYPYSRCVYRFSNGLFIVKVDGGKFEAFVWKVDADSGVRECVFKAALRDRRFDGTPAADDCALSHYTYSDSVHHRRLAIGEHTSLEISIYGFKPGTRLADSEFDAFVEHPYQFLKHPEKFRQLFDKAWLSGRAPGQNAQPIDDVARLTPAAFVKIATQLGYDFLETAPSHWHVAKWFETRGYRYSSDAHAQLMARFQEGIDKVRIRLACQDRKLARNQEPWLCVLQHLAHPQVNRPDLIPDELRLPGLLWPQDNINPEVLWMNKPLNARAKRLLP